MRLTSLYIENFRIFGSADNSRQLSLDVRPGLTVLVGENDSGKTAVIDALRLALGAKGQDFLRITDDDFHREKGVTAGAFKISCRFEQLSESEQARFVEWLTLSADSPALEITLSVLRAKRVGKSGAASFVPEATWRTGPDGTGKAVEGDLRSYLLSTYLKALRDADQEMTAGRGSRLSQLLLSHSALKGQDKDSEMTFPGGGQPMVPPDTLIGIIRTAEKWIKTSKALNDAKQELNSEYLEKLSTDSDTLQGEITIARGADLRSILEKLELFLVSKLSPDERTRHGLGLNNLLFMAAELLLLSESNETGLPILLIEEPEAHLHPQLQLRLMEFLETKALEAGVQVIVTTHSPTLAAKADVESLTMMGSGQAYALAAKHTHLTPGDYRFLRRFLDATKSNLFFAGGVVIVEGDAENVLLPVLARLLGRPFTKHRVSVVNVGHVGLFRYARIFLRKDGRLPPVRIACLTDRDIPPEAARAYVKAKSPTRDVGNDFSAQKIDGIVAALKKGDAGVVRTFVSPGWTLEHDLALGNAAKQVHIAVSIAKELKNHDGVFGEAEHAAAQTAAATYYDQHLAALGAEDRAARIYEPMFKKQASKPETAQVLADILIAANFDAVASRALLPQYLVEAIDYVTGADAPVPPAGAGAPVAANANPAPAH
jgi:putative ATP-dependent endonuclease of OLD family